MRVYAGMDPSGSLRDVPAYARRVEALGFDGLHVAETLHDSLAVSLLVAEHTERITIRTALTLAFVRSPLLTAYTAWDLARLSGGRFELGLGTQIRQNVTDRYGMPWSEPVRRMREYVDAVRTAFTAFRTGKLTPYEGETYRLTRLQPFFNPGPAETREPTLWLGGVNAGICELAGEVADGFVTHPTNSDPRYLEELALPHLRVGADRAGRSLDDLDVVVSPPVITGATAAALADSREGARQSMAFLYSTPAYRRTLELHGIGELGEQLQQLTRDQAWDRLAEVVTDDVLDLLVPAGSYDELPGVLAERYAGLAQGVVLHPPKDPADDEAFARVIRAVQDAGP